MHNWRWHIATMIILLSSGHAAYAEQWLANKFSQNCASCHAPGRKNVEFKNRRCTLSCQSCHVNPNGGGLRNFYGKWNENHWLSTYKIKDYLENEDPPAPLADQKYASVAENRVIRKLYTKIGPPLMYSETRPADMSVYGPTADKNHEEMVTEENREDWLTTVPEEDPYREMDRIKVDGGADFRYVVQSISTTREVDGKETSDTNTDNWLMTGDIGIRFRPIYRKLHLVFENRYIGQPIDKVSDWNSEFVRRSMYAMLDDMPYNSFGMIGVYKPLIGNNKADHTLLSEVIKSQTLVDNDEGYGFAYEGLSLGAAPGIPFANVHLLGRQYFNGKMANDSHIGFASNLGARFTTLGLSTTYTFVFSKRDDLSQTEAKALIHDLTLGAQLGRATVNLDFMYYSKSVEDKTYINGNYFGGDVYLQVWQDVYGFVSGGYTTTSKTLRPGSSLQFRAGSRAFLLPGVDLSLAVVYDVDKTTKETVNTDDTTLDHFGVSGQIHLYL